MTIDINLLRKQIHDSTDLKLTITTLGGRTLLVVLGRNTDHIDMSMAVDNRMHCVRRCLGNPKVTNVDVNDIITLNDDIVATAVLL